MRNDVTMEGPMVTPKVNVSYGVKFFLHGLQIVSLGYSIVSLLESWLISAGIILYIPPRAVLSGYVPISSSGRERWSLY